MKEIVVLATMVFTLSASSSLAQTYLARIRDAALQKDRSHFRSNLGRLGQIMAYEISKVLPSHQRTVETPLGRATVNEPADHPVLVCVLRAGIPYFQGFSDYFDRSDCAFIGAYRGKEDDKHIFNIELDYVAAPSLEGRGVILVDPMLATGKSVVKACQALYRHGTPSYLHVASVVAAPEGIRCLEEELPHAGIWTGCIDEGLSDHAYIVPGLGDAGDLAFGPKL